MKKITPMTKEKLVMLLERALRYGYYNGYIDKESGANRMYVDECWRDFSKLILKPEELE